MCALFIKEIDTSHAFGLAGGIVPNEFDLTSWKSTRQQGRLQKNPYGSLCYYLSCFLYGVNDSRMDSVLTSGLRFFITTPYVDWSLLLFFFGSFQVASTTYLGRRRRCAISKSDVGGRGHGIVQGGMYVVCDKQKVC